MSKQKTMYDDVATFHKKFNIPTAGNGPCQMPDQSIIEYRTKFLKEELVEFMEACEEGSLVDAFDALLDIAWVAMGTAHYFGAPWEEGWEEVARANMDRVLVTRENCPPEKRYRRHMVMKPEGWKPPDLLRVIRDHNMAMNQRCFSFDGEPKTPSDVVSLEDFTPDGAEQLHSFNCICETCVPNDEASGD